MTGEMLVELAETYVSALNSDAVPTISSAWERVVDGELRRVYDHASCELEHHLRVIINKQLPLEEPEL